MQLVLLLVGLMIVALPIVVVRRAVPRLGLRQELVMLGALTFVLSQVVHVPLNLAVAELVRRGVIPRPPPEVVVWLLPLALGLSAGLCEEVARYVGLRWARLRGGRRRIWRAGVAEGLGHGGMEALLVGIALIVAALVPLVLGAPAHAAALPAEAPRFDPVLLLPLVAVVERLFAMMAHVGLAVMVARATRRGVGWLVLAVLLHAALDAGALMLLEGSGPLAAELWVAAMGLALLGWAWRQRPRRAPAA